MTKSEIREALNLALDNYDAGEQEVLSETQNVQLTDELAGVLETVNPNHNYPPTNKP